MREKIMRGGGVTPSEQRLASLAERAFLRLWSYPNTFNDRTKSACGGGQEFADLLAVFGDDVLIFSDKDINWQADKPVELAWSRWYRRAVEGAVNQLVGAARWLDRHPDRIFTDKACLQTLPIAVPPKDRRTVHLVAIASGATEACKHHFGHARGTFMILPQLEGPAHVDASRAAFQPFMVGDVNPGGDFVHLFDPVGLDFVMRELDTAQDFITYLGARAQFIRSGRLGIAAGEDDLLAAYMMNGFIEGKPSFIPQTMHEETQQILVTIPEGEYETYTSSIVYRELQIAREQSYYWDRIIEIISEDVIGGTTIPMLGVEPSTDISERGLRIMAAEDRMTRIGLANALDGAVRRLVTDDMARFVRRSIPDRKSSQLQTGYVFVIAPFHKGEGSYEDYRQYRSMMLHTYCSALFREQAQLRTVVGLALDVYLDQGEIKTRSEDLLGMDAPEWTPEFLANFELARAYFGLMDARDLEVKGPKGAQGKSTSPFSVEIQKF